VIRRHAGDLELTLIFEIGRMIAGNAGILVTRVLNLKHGEGKLFVIVDAAMNDLIRPTLYDAFHEVRPVVDPGAGTQRFVADVVGPVCESGDYLALAREMPAVKAGDLLAFMTAGAYGAVQASTYNTRLLVPEVMVNGDASAVVRPRPSYEELIGLDRMPAWLTE
jgi:diaminopimelate decarboxylase